MLAQNIELGYLADGNIALASDTAFEHEVKRVEYYRDQKLLMLVYQGGDKEDDLLHYELNDDAAYKVEHARNVVIYADNAGNGQPEAYFTYLIKVGL